jgi:Ca2+-binding RTX toxin-like protein
MGSTLRRGASVAAAVLLVGGAGPVLSSAAAAQSSAPSAIQVRSASDKAALAAQPVDPSNRGIILKFREGSGVRLRSGAFVAPAGTDVSGVNGVLRNAPGASVGRLFQRSEDAIASDKARVEQRSRRQQADLNLYYRVVAPGGADVAALIAALNRLGVVEAASSEPRATAPPVTPNFSAQQTYRAAAPDGIGANVVSSLPGGKGQNIEITDVEYSWNVNHEDLTKAPAAVIANGTPSDPFSDTNHGTAVLGEIVGDENSFGVTGIVSGATLNLVNANNTGGYALANAINLAAAASNPGDVILIEQQTTGPNGGCNATSQVGCAPVEWVQAFYDAIVLATSAGIHVVEAAGNGTQDLDSAPYAPLNARADSGAIMVGAGGAPGCTNPARGRLDFSNFGARVNLQGYGECVVTTGYGTLQTGAANELYSNSFSGTSSASPIVAGAAGLLSSIAQGRGVTHTPTQLRAILTETGTPQQFGLAGSIGPLPNLARAAASFDCTTPPPATITVAAPGLITTGTPGDDVILGTAGIDRISGGGGNDIILGGGGADDLSGGDGNDTLCGGAGADRLAGNAGNDALFGEADNDLLTGGAGDDGLFGGPGSDTLSGDAGTDNCVGGPDSDTVAAAPSCDAIS